MKAVGATAIDAPVSGGTGGAAAGTLTFMVGGSSEEFEASKVILSKMGAKLVHCGGVGNGQVAKLCNNLLLGICMLGTSEAYALGIKLGADPALLATVINSSSGQNWSSEKYNPVPGVMPASAASRGYTGGFAAELMLKDLGLAKEAADNVKLALPLGHVAHAKYTMMKNSGEGGRDFSAIFESVMKNK